MSVQAGNVDTEIQTLEQGLEIQRISLNGINDVIQERFVINSKYEYVCMMFPTPLIAMHFAEFGLLTKSEV